jgi:hypothetical protein
VNLFAFVENNGVNLRDYLGLFHAFGQASVTAFFAVIPIIEDANCPDLVMGMGLKFGSGDPQGIGNADFENAFGAVLNAAYQEAGNDAKSKLDEDCCRIGRVQQIDYILSVSWVAEGVDIHIETVNIKGKGLGG